ncbi:type III polyketide synthase [soil metagenome]
MNARRMPAIVGLGCATPQCNATQAAAAEFAIRAGGLTGDAARFAEVIYMRAGIDARASVLLKTTASKDVPLEQSFFGERSGSDDRGPTTQARMRAYASLAGPLGIEAAGSALRDAAPLLGESPEKRITHLVTVSCTGFAAPGLDVALILALGLSPAVQRVNVGFMGCHGGVVGLRVAGDLAAASGAGARVLLVCVELCSIHMQYSERPDQIVANALFGDGAGAAVVACDEELMDGHRVTASGALPLMIRSSASMLVPQSLSAMGWEIGDHGFEMTLAESVPDLIRAHLGPWMAQWLGACGLSLDSARSSARWAVHPGGPRVLSAVGNALGLDDAALECSRSVLRDHGNMSSPTVLFILERLERRARQHPQSQRSDAPVVMLGFGPGLTAEAILLAPWKG